ncbi:MAG: hypothetical protein H6662_14985 [Ardenticatenaceae bacterium]|nr:hypothetical protein [Ardenticatenaceae bacterium]MCB8990372.1 hypothetical protein [Ardenticatenaceae bacterium]
MTKHLVPRLSRPDAPSPGETARRHGRLFCPMPFRAVPPLPTPLTMNN